jgi:Ser/Thr protein kinase RdoA (MazF antagonist)
VQDLAVAAAYQFEPTGHPLEGPAEVAAAFHQLYPLLPEEVEILPDFIGARFALAIAISFWRAARHPDNAAYIMRNQNAAWSGLQRLNEISRDGAIDWLHKRIGTR